MSAAPWLVVKFGGTSVASRERWNTIRDVIQHYISSGYRVLIVCSAAAKVSNLLINAIDGACDQHFADCYQSIHDIYTELANQLGLSEDCITDYLQQLHQLLHGIALLSDASDKVRAKVMAHGELILTKLGHAFLQQQGIHNHWLDARHYLHSTPSPDCLMGMCEDDIDQALQAKLNQFEHPVLLTQGYISGDDDGHTVLLGRGGSDSSAAFFAAKLSAERLEIWTDVPGIYTANPQQIPQARLLMHLNYNEAQEIASMGAKVLHPRCIAPAQKHAIPLHIKQTCKPERDGTVISFDSKQINLPIKAIISKLNILLITIETVDMWRQVGFLSQVFECFKIHGLSIDLISTSEASVTVSIDNNNGSYSNKTINRLLAELNQFSTAKLIGPCASVSLVGENIRMVLHQLGDTFALFESQQIHMMSLAANNLNLTFVVDSDQAERLSRQLHTLLVEQHPRLHQLGLSWQEEFGDKVDQPTPWWQHKRDQLLSLLTDQSAHYVYDMDSIDHAISQLKQLSSVDRLFYAMKANSHNAILERVHDANVNFECVSIAEIKKVRQLFPKIDSQRILFTPNFAERREYQQALEQGVIVTIDSTYPIEHWPELFSQHRIMLRVDPGYGAGHHKYVCTGGSDSKFGIPIDQLDAVKRQLKAHKIHVHGLHIHSGSGILDANSWSQSFERLLNLIEQFPEAICVNLGGGLGIVEKPGQTPLDMQALDQALASIKAQKPTIELWMEPGRFLVARSGVIIAKVTQVKTKGDTHFVGIATGMNSLIRPALYGAYHEIVNLSKLDEPKTEIANIVGPICESGDTLGYCRALPVTEEGDVILIANTGAYGYCMGSHYNLREPAPELVV